MSLSFGHGEYNYSTSRLSLAFIATTAFYALSGIAMIVVSILFKAYVARPVENGTIAATVLALKPIDLNHGILTGAIVLLAVALSIPGTFASSKAWLKASFVVNLMSILATLAIGLEIWFFTLIEVQEYRPLWSQSNNTGLIQDKFNCCGYFDSTSPKYVTSLACPNDDTALSKVGCVYLLTEYADSLMNVLFTTIFGLSGLSLIALLAGLILIKRMTELERFRNIDSKKMSS